MWFGFERMYIIRDSIIYMVRRFSIYIILTNAYTLITLYFDFFYMELEEEENNRGNQQNIWPNNPSHGSSSITDNSSNEEWWSIYLDINASCCIFWNNCLWKSDILFNVMDIVLSQLKYKGLPIRVPFCMTKSLLFIYNKKHFILFYFIVKCYIID